MLGDRTVAVIAWVVTAVWTATVIVDALSASYTVPYAVHGIMGLVAGSAFGERYVVRKKMNRNGA